MLHLTGLYMTALHHSGLYRDIQGCAVPHCATGDILGHTGLPRAIQDCIGPYWGHTGCPRPPSLEPLGISYICSPTGEAGPGFTSFPTKKKKKKHFRAISNNIIDMAIRMFLYIKSTEENKQRKNRAVLVVMRIAL